LTGCYKCCALLSVGLFALLGGGTLSAQPVSGEVPANVVAISASGQLEVPQDWLTMTLTTSREGSDAAAVQSQLRQAVDAALAIAKPAVVREQMEVRTGSFGVYPRRGNNGRITGWQGSAELVLEGRDFVVISRTAGKVTSLNVGHVAFSLSPAARQKLESEAQALAIERFKARANHWAAQPPSMFQATPRTLLPAGEQKNTASSPSSSGVVNCIDGSFSPSSTLASSLTAQRGGFGVHLLLHQRRQHPARADGVAGHAGGGVFQRRDLGQADHPVLGRHIGRLFCRSHQAVHRRHVDDAAPVGRRMAGNARRVAWKALERLMAMIASQRSTGKSSTLATCWMPALFTRMSTRPNAVAANFIMASISAGLLMSAPW
jgi:predicted secreted protein